MSDSLAGVPEISSATYDRLAVGDRFGPFTESFASARPTSCAARSARSSRAPTRRRASCRS